MSHTFRVKCCAQRHNSIISLEKKILHISPFYLGKNLMYDRFNQTFRAFVLKASFVESTILNLHNEFLLTLELEISSVLNAKMYNLHMIWSKRVLLQCTEVHLSKRTCTFVWSKLREINFVKNVRSYGRELSKLWT